MRKVYVLQYHCVGCGAEFESQDRRHIFCSTACEAVFDRRNPSFCVVCSEVTQQVERGPVRKYCCKAHSVIDNTDRAHPETQKEYQVAFKGARPKRWLWLLARTRARNKGCLFTITEDDIPDVPEFCPVFPHIKLTWEGGMRERDTSPSLDRIIPALGYVPGNVRVISMKANRCKNDFTPEELRLAADDSEFLEPPDSEYWLRKQTDLDTALWDRIRYMHDTFAEYPEDTHEISLVEDVSAPDMYNIVIAERPSHSA